MPIQSLAPDRPTLPLAMRGLSVPAPWCDDCRCVHARPCYAQQRINRALDALGFALLILTSILLGLAAGALTL
ncbi:hypothetical protein SEA_MARCOLIUSPRIME_50 [Mycobacterium phage Marcoliusprime]|uniref:Uncharacterized protein n=1 Tax=Mycobacterium phage Findley TaxID=2015882 RepID=A0A222ZS30_9CAUD|nr:hypothetical protein MILLY_50 [Mycobacterium phage Milly]YP_009951136.1 hypothetical protein I5G77_gp50 [Mycobacterium phage Findley]AOZ64387.1 hypothetical protein SEA_MARCOLIUSPRIME_50 [Mycobacterium phage Marcoliusprime]ASR86593.1 hypothetical protein SEA_DISMALFUNK_50 [Mycobacterium phage DismalFunk]AYB69004.1 hypothetical protein SEA_DISMALSTRESSOR_50 [Mycobacterium phage DismalStressor]AJA43723.1 hypothetical protein MILLY_50 [Mycobacterium phage Milly]ASR86790.1 hypothetical protein